MLTANSALAFVLLIALLPQASAYTVEMRLVASVAGDEKAFANGAEYAPGQVDATFFLPSVPYISLENEIVLALAFAGTRLLSLSVNNIGQPPLLAMEQDGTGSRFIIAMAKTSRSGTHSGLSSGAVHKSRYGSDAGLLPAVSGIVHLFAVSPMPIYGSVYPRTLVRNAGDKIVLERG